MTHHERPSFALGDTTFHFVQGDPAVLALALEAAQGQDVRLGRGATTVRQFLDADLVDTMHVAVAPVGLGAAARLWHSLDELLDRLHLEVVPSPSGGVSSGRACHRPVAAIASASDVPSTTRPVPADQDVSVARSASAARRPGRTSDRAAAGLVR